MDDLIRRARGGDAEAFRELVEPYRRELLVHCYRMLGSYQDAEDTLQESLLAAWLGFAGFEGRSAPRTWLYRITTNRCLNARRSAARRPAKEWDAPDMAAPEPTDLGEVLWLEPFPDGPEPAYERAETISLAFVTALQLLPPRQVAVLVLRDVLSFRGAEVAAMLDTTEESVAGALKRARAGLRSRLPQTGPAPVPGSVAEEAVVARFVRAYESADLDALLALLTDDVFLSMPPIAFQYRGRAAFGRFYAAVFRGGRRTLVPTRANGRPAFGLYARSADGVRHGTGLIVLDLAGDRVGAVTRFESGVLPWFGLPRSLPG